MSCLNLILPVWHISTSVYKSSYCAACQRKKNIDQITPNLCAANNVVRSWFYISNPDPLKVVHFVSFLLWGPATSVPTTDKQVAWQEPSMSDITGPPQSLWWIFPHHSACTFWGGRGVLLSVQIKWPSNKDGYQLLAGTATTQPQWLSPSHLLSVLSESSECSSGMAANDNYLTSHWVACVKQPYTLRYVLYLGKYDSPSAARSFALSWSGLLLVKGAGHPANGTDSWEKNMPMF